MYHLAGYTPSLQLGLFCIFKIFPYVEGEILIFPLLDTGAQFVLFILFFESVRDLYLNKREMRLGKNIGGFFFLNTIIFCDGLLRNREALGYGET